MKIKAGLRTLATVAILGCASLVSAGVAHADAPVLPQHWRLVNVATGECLTAHAQGNYAGQAPCNGSAAQSWNAWSVAGNYRLQDAADLQCLRLIPGSASVDTVACDWSFKDTSQSQIWWVDADLNPSAIVSIAVGSGRPLLAAVGSANVLASFNGSGNISWYH